MDFKMITILRKSYVGEENIIMMIISDDTYTITVHHIIDNNNAIMVSYYCNQFSD